MSAKQQYGDNFLVSSASSFYDDYDERLKRAKVENYFYCDNGMGGIVMTMLDFIKSEGL